MKTVLMLGMLFLISCSSYVKRIHDQIDRENGEGKYQKQDKFDLYRKNKLSEKNNLPHGEKANAGNVKSFHPAVKRQYLPQELIKKRYTSEDLLDNQPEGSLWVGNDSNAFLFSDDNKKRSGDVVLISVKTDLKNEITAALKKAFPDPPKKEKATKEKGETADAGAAEKDNKKEKAPEEEQVIDKISSVVIEEINRDHLLLRGRKTVLFKGNKKAVEVQALVSRKDVDSEDNIDSVNILESTINVVR